MLRFEMFFDFVMNQPNKHIVFDFFGTGLMKPVGYIYIFSYLFFIISGEFGRIILT